MARKWSREDLIIISQSGLSFTPQQSRSIRAEVEKRMRNPIVDINDHNAQRKK